MAELLKASGDIKIVNPKEGKTFSLKELQEYVGGFIETISSLDGNHIMVVNEEGKLMGLPFNYCATIRLINEFSKMDHIVGDALICRCNEIE